MSANADLFRTLFRYEQDSHQKVVGALRAGESAEANREVLQKAIDMMAHIIAARQVWLWRIGAVDTRPDGVFPKDVAISDLERTTHKTNALWDEYLARLDDVELDRRIEYKTLDGRPFTNRVEEMLIQLHGHSMYHRGQIAVWLREAGATPVSTDYILWTRDQRQ